MHYIETLPNFFCIEATSRSFDHSGNGHWKLHDTLTELLTYKDKHEEHKTIQINGQASNFDRADVTAGALKSAAISAGELGGVFRAVFDPRSQTEFQWKETDSLRDGTVQVFTYKVDKANSQFSVTGANNRQILVAFHGQVYIDSTTHSVRRLTMIADGIPVDFPTHSTSIGVDYDYIAINDRDYLLPISAELRLTQGKHESILNAIEFRDYHRFGSTAKIFMDPASEPK